MKNTRRDSFKINQRSFKMYGHHVINNCAGEFPSKKTSLPKRNQLLTVLVYSPSQNNPIAKRKSLFFTVRHQQNNLKCI